MLKDITLGQYFPGDTIVHRLDPRSKLILVVLYIAALFQASGWISYLTVTAATALCMILSHIRPKNIFKGLKPMLFIIILTALLTCSIPADGRSSPAGTSPGRALKSPCR